MSGSPEIKSQKNVTNHHKKTCQKERKLSCEEGGQRNVQKVKKKAKRPPRKIKIVINDDKTLDRKE